jgi:glycogen synthase
MRFALVAKEVHPFVPGGGLGRYVTATAETLAPLGEVILFTTSAYEARYHELVAEGSPDLPTGVRIEFVPEPTPEDGGAFLHGFQLWGANVLDALRETYGNDGPDLVEFPDYLGEGCVVLQARRTLHPTLRNSCVCVRLYTTAEMISVLNGDLPGDFDTQVLYDLERISLRYADRIVYGGGDVYSTFERFYPDEELAPGYEILHSVPLDGSPPEDETEETDGSLRLLYLGRMERRKGVQNLLRAVTALPREDWTLTLVGGDTMTAPLRTSMRAQLELMAANDERIKFRDRVPSRDVSSLVRSHDLCVVPSLWECWPNVALEALSQNRPVLASPTGGLVGIVEHGRSGWFTREVGERSLRDALETLLSEPERVRALSRSGSLRERFERLTDRDVVRAKYKELVEAHRTTFKRPVARTQDPLVSVVIPYFELEEFLEETLLSVFAQTYRELEVIVVNDGSLRAEDAVLDELAGRYPIEIVTQQNSGLGAARNFGISQCRGRYVFPMDADDLLAPTFIERCVEVLQADPEVAYVTSWSHFIDEDGTVLPRGTAGYSPLGNRTRALDRLNVAGSAESVFDRRIFDLGLRYSVDIANYEDWVLFREMRDKGFEGRIIPEPLLFYRVRSASMTRTVGMPEHHRLVGEIEGHLREAEVAWTPRKG